MSYIISNEIVEFKCDNCNKPLWHTIDATKVGLIDALHSDGVIDTHAYCNEDCAKAANEII